jgi:predicted amidohydrolase
MRVVNHKLNLTAMKKYSGTITRRSFVEGSGVVAGGLTLLPGSVINGLGRQTRNNIPDIFARDTGKMVNTNSPPSTGTPISDSSDKKEAFILKKLPDYYKLGCSTVKIGMCQVFTEEWAVEANIERTLEAIDLAARQGAEIAVTPECVFHGYPFDESNGKSESFRKKLFSVAESPEGENLKLFREKARDKGIYVLVGFAEKGEGEVIHNTAALISPEGRYVYLYRKVHCRHFENINHWGYFTPGSDFYTADLQFNGKHFNVGTIICFDREIPESLRCIRSLGAELVLCPLATDTSDMTKYKNETDNEIITRVGSTCNELFIVVVNHAGRFNGGSFITGPKGELFCQMNDDPGVLTYDVPAGIISEEFHNKPLGWMGWGYRRPDIYKKYI